MLALQNVSIFLIDTLFSLYINIVLVRFLLSQSKADFYNPISQFLIKATNPVLLPLRRFIPSIGRIDTSALVLALILKVIQFFLLINLGINAISLGAGQGDIIGVLLGAILALTKAVVWIYIISMVVLAILSWFGNMSGNPMLGILRSLTEPLLRPVRNFMPNTGMIDFSPMIVILLLYIVLIILESSGL